MLLGGEPCSGGAEGLIIRRTLHRKLGGFHALNRRAPPHEQFLAEGVKHVFANPGSTELFFTDALQDYPQIQYVMGLHETVPMAMADGTAARQASPPWSTYTSRPASPTQ